MTYTADDLVPDDPSHPIWTGRDNNTLPPWPEWVTGFRPWQVDAAREVVDGLMRGQDLMLLDAPTGTGKTIIGEMVRRAMTVEGGGKATYICHSLRLQDQFLADFKYATVVKGRSNYPTECGPSWVTAADCQGRDCIYCDDVCPYREAKTAGVAGQLTVANTAYWLHETNYVKEGLRGRRGLVIDECDTLESALLGFVEVVVGEDVQRKAGVGALGKGVHAATVAEWLREVEVGCKLWAHQNRLSRDVKVVRDVKRMRGVGQKARMLAEVYESEAEGEGDSTVEWVRDYPYKGNAAIWKPVKVNQHAVGSIWRRGAWGVQPGGERDEGTGGWGLAMSATFVSPAEWIDSLGVDEAGLDWDVVKIDSPFPVENRMIWYAPQGDMGYKTWERDSDKMVDGVVKVLDLHPEAATLIHTVNYKLTKRIVEGLRARGVGSERRIFTHETSGGKEGALGGYLAAVGKGVRGPVIISPSLDRGVDLPGDACRLQIIAKVPFPNLGDRQISTRTYGPGGQGWFSVQVARTLIQMTGRGVRSATDHADTYILDAQFGRWWKDGMRLVPRWWRAAVKVKRL